MALVKIAEQVKNKVMLIKELQKLKFNFNTLPKSIRDSVKLLGIYTSGTFESDNQKINVLDSSIFDAIQKKYPTDKIVLLVSKKRDEEESEIYNDGFNTVLE